ncbi:hypothetical protein [Mycolicibacterium aichiense]|uniref:Uncharacterized protein n=1 Tax=Mycolicibacterium aichiense TaxID=1799 RepID=A0AAD1HXM6_9MYCO|nr:hypothetical protein [Mycolicibacterium aichiense]MCV7017007.1 hypothetical protein [Mycolicibacterium aichiense]BBX10566.1 hypothetical protein MAIC_53690 [Mycolicibacterium aichiense]STZ25776.1 Uncharacterised protein [Mycolicibacterium aichiense]
MSDVVGLPVRVRVVGRPGCGRRTVTRVLRGAGVAVVTSTAAADLDVHVFAETVKPEDRHALTTSPRPVVAVLNKADLTGFGGSGPVAAAAERCRLLSERVGVPVYPLAGLAAAAAVDDRILDDEMLGALRRLTVDPADLGSTDRFATGRHALPDAVRRRLLVDLDLFGIAHAVLALRNGADRTAVISALRQASALDGLLAGLEAAAAPVRYRRLTEEFGDSAAEEAVAARMAAAIDVVQAAGMTVDADVSAQAHLRRAVVWQRYSGGPVSRLHSRCGADIARGSLRLWERAGGIPEALP